ncbi:hypothetical protein BH18ACI5_BH18ACI5_06610 [soil metagenome]
MAHGSDNVVRPPRWLMPASFAVLGITLGFMMLLVLLATFDKQVPTGSRYLVVIVLALGAAFGIGGLGGEAAVRGKIPLPGAQQHPLAVSVTGGVAVMIIVLLLRDVIVPRDSSEPDLTLSALKGVVTSADPPRVMLTAAFEGFSVTGGDRLTLALCKDDGCLSVLQTARIDQPTQGNMVIFVAAARSSVQAAGSFLRTQTVEKLRKGSPNRLYGESHD